MAGESASSRRVNVLLLTTALGIGGAEVVVRDLVRLIDSRRFNVSVCCLRVLGSIGEELAREGVDITVLSQGGRDGGVDYLTSLKLRRLIKARSINLVHTHTSDAFLDACLCKLTLPGLKVVHTFHYGNYPHRAKRKLWTEALCARLADRLIAVGNVQRQQIQSVFRLRATRVDVIWNGIQHPRDAGDPAFRSRVAGDGTVLVGTLANLIEQKGLADLLRVARRVRDVHDKVRFVVAGEGALRLELERLRRELGLDDTVLFAGWLPNAAHTFLPAIDIYFQPSLWEAMSIAILEAMAASKPVVATRVGEAPFVISDGDDGLLAAPRDIDAMARCISHLIDDPTAGRRIGEAAARKAREQFTAERMARAYESVYLQVTGRGCSG